jgi:hypothetical protein
MERSNRRRQLLDGETRQWLREEINKRRREQELHSGRLTQRGFRRSARR